MVYFQTKSPVLVHFVTVVDWKLLISFKTIWYVYFVDCCFILCQFGIFCGLLLLYYPLFSYVALRKMGQPCF
jgi:hypothetical protein